MTEADLPALFSARLLAVAEDYLAQERVAARRRGPGIVAAEVHGFSDDYFVVWRDGAEGPTGRCSDGRTRCRHLAAVLLAWVRAPETFASVPDLLAGLPPTALRLAVEEAVLTGADLWSLLQRPSANGAPTPAELAAWAERADDEDPALGADVPFPTLLEAYLVADEAGARRLLPLVLARRDEESLERATARALAHLWRRVADGGDPVPVALRLAALSPEAGVRLAEARRAPPAAVARLLAAAGREELARHVVDLGLLTATSGEERRALLAEAIALSARLPGRLRRYLEESVAEGDEDRLPSWWDLVGHDVDAARAFATRLLHLGRRAAACRLLLLAGLDAELLAALTPDLPPDLLLAAARRLGAARPQAMGTLLAAAADRAPPAWRARLWRAAERLRSPRPR